MGDALEWLFGKNRLPPGLQDRVRASHGFTKADAYGDPATVCRNGCEMTCLDVLRTLRFCSEINREWMHQASRVVAAKDFADADPLSPWREVSLRIAHLRGEVRRLDRVWGKWSRQGIPPDLPQELIPACCQPNPCVRHWPGWPWTEAPESWREVFRDRPDQGWNYLSQMILNGSAVVEIRPGEPARVLGTTHDVVLRTRPGSRARWAGTVFGDRTPDVRTGGRTPLPGIQAPLSVPPDAPYDTSVRPWSRSVRDDRDPAVSVVSQGGQVRITPLGHGGVLSSDTVLDVLSVSYTPEPVRDGPGVVFRPMTGAVDFSLTREEARRIADIFGLPLDMVDPRNPADTRPTDLADG